MRRGSALLVLVAVTLLAGCAGDAEPDPGQRASGVGSTEPTATTAPGGATATSTSPASSTTVATEAGIGKLQLGMTLAAARATGQIGATQPGCELGGPGELVANLTTGVDGQAFFVDDKLEGIVIRSGAKTAAGVGPGSTLDEVKSAYSAAPYSVKVSSDTRPVFGFDIANVFRGNADVFEFDVDPDTDKAGSLAIPDLRLCD